MSKEGNWYKIEVPAWVTGVVINNCGYAQTADLTVTKGKDVWIVVENDSSFSAKVHYSKPAMPDDGMESAPNTVTIHANVPANWLTPFCWAWSGTQNAFSTWPGVAMTKSGDWYEIQVPNWIDSVIVSNKGTPQTADLSVPKGKNLWLVVNLSGEVDIYETEPDISASSTPSPHTLQHSDLKYVMIYNPYIYDERLSWNTSSLSSGYLGSIMKVGSYGYSNSIMVPDTDDVSLAPASTRAGSTQYSVGDTKQFYCTKAGSSEMAIRALRTMTCGYVGKYCYVWSDGSLSSSLMKMYGQEFDNNVYETLVDLFGEVSWVGQEKMVHLMFYPIAGGTGGYFIGTDMQSSRYVSAADAAANQMNLDHPMLHFNANLATTSAQQYQMKSTLAHEFQHMLCYSASVKSGVECRVWLNEVMSAYIEEHLHPNIKLNNGFVSNYNDSYLYRDGQSLYNFGQLADSYGLVYCFAKYLTTYGGEDVFSNIHDYWRNSNGYGLNEAKAIYYSVSDDFRKLIDDNYSFGNGIIFASKEEAWLSKMTLHFYLVMVDKDANLPFHSHIQNASLLYTKQTPTVIEGGGRIIVATNGNSFDVPGNAGSGLIYVGLDEDFEVVTSYISK